MLLVTQKLPHFSPFLLGLMFCRPLQFLTGFGVGPFLDDSNFILFHSQFEKSELVARNELGRYGAATQPWGAIFILVVGTVDI